MLEQGECGGVVVGFTGELYRFSSGENFFRWQVVRGLFRSKHRCSRRTCKRTLIQTQPTMKHRLINACKH